MRTVSSGRVSMAPSELDTSVVVVFSPMLFWAGHFNGTTKEPRVCKNTSNTLATKRSAPKSA